MLLFSYISKYLLKVLPIKIISLSRGEYVLIASFLDVLPIVSFLKLHTNTQFSYLSDICGVDYIQNKNRFEVVYNLLSVNYNQRIRLRCSLNAFATISSITSVFANANWWEREAWDMYGIFFNNHPNLRRILTDYGFLGYPLRKDFPLTGFIEVRYKNHRVVNEMLLN